MSTLTAKQTETEDRPVAEDLASMVNEGTSALQEGNLEVALANFERVIQAFPDRPEGHNNLGALYSALGDLTKAETCFNRVLDILPGNTNVTYNRGLIRARLEKFALAQGDFESVLEASPQDADANNNLGVALFMQGRLQKARACFTRTLEVKPDHANALINLSDLESASGNHAQAVSLCETFLASYSNTEVRRKLLDLLSSGCRQALEKASRTAELLLAARDDDTEVRRELGRIIQAQDAMEIRPEP